MGTHGIIPGSCGAPFCVWVFVFLMPYHGISIGHASSFSLFFHEAFLDQFVERISQLPVLAVPERRIRTRRLQSTFVSQFNHRSCQQGRVPCLRLVQEVDIEFEGCRTEVPEQREVYIRRVASPFLFVRVDE